MQGIEIEEAFVRDFGRKIGKGMHAASRCKVNETVSKTDVPRRDTSEDAENSDGKKCEHASDDANAFDAPDEAEDWPGTMACLKAEAAERKIKYSFIAVVVIFIAIFCSLFISCTTVKYVPVESSSNVRDSLRIRDSLVVHNVVNQRDSVILRDSVIQVVDEQGNVIRTELYRYKEVNRNLTIENERLKKELEEARTHRTDSVQQPVFIEKPLTRWQQFKLQAGEIAFTLIGIMAFILIFEIGKKVLANKN